MCMHMHMCMYMLCMLKQDQRERRGKELTELLLREWKDKKKTKDKNNAVAWAEKVTARDVSQKRCLDSEMVCHQ